MLNKLKRTIMLFLCINVLSLCTFSFAESYDELSDIYVTREEWSKWIDTIQGNISELENAINYKLNNEIRFEMWAKNMDDETDPVSDVRQKEQYEMKRQAINDGESSNVYSITLVLNGGFWRNSLQPLMYRKGNEETQLPDVKDIYNTGKTFVGWSDNINLSGGIVTSIPADTYKPTIYYAKWKDNGAEDDPADYVNFIKLTYHTNGGSWTSSVPTMYYEQNKGMSLPDENHINRRGYDFDGWYKSSVCSPADKLISIEANVDPAIKDVYAKWEEASYDITYDIGGGSWVSFVPTTSRKYTEAVAVPDADKLSYANHIFVGWYDNPSYAGNKVTNIPSYTIGKKSLYAKWVQTTYNVSFNENGGTYVGIEEPVSREYLSTFTLPTADQIKKTGYDFAGWHTDKYFSEKPVASIPAETEGDKTFYANWTETVYTMNYHLDNGTTTASLPTTRKYSVSITLPNFDQMSANTGYKFRGWFADADHTTIITRVQGYTETTDVYPWFEPMNNWGVKGSDGNWDGIDYNNWMSKIPDDMYLSEINIPGTHDSGCKSVEADGDVADFLGGAGEEFAKTQSFYLVGDSDTQLEQGVRAIDIRLDNNGYLCHGSERVVIGKIPFIGTELTVNMKFWCEDANGNKINLDAVFNKASKFLHDHPTETIVMLVTNESGSGTTANAKTAVDNCISKYVAGYSSRSNYKGVYKGTTIPKLKDVRGKIVVISDGLGLSNCINYSGMKGGTLDGVSYVYENNYDVKKDAKWNYINAALEKCTTKINTQINKSSKTSSSANIWTTSNCAGDLSNSPNAVDDYVDPRRRSYNWKQGNAYGIIWMDFARTSDTNYVIASNP